MKTTDTLVLLTAPLYWGSTLALRATTSFGGATLLEYETVDISDENRSVFIHCFDVSPYGADGKVGTLETAKEWLRCRSYYCEYTRLLLSGELDNGFKSRASRLASSVLRNTEWVCGRNEKGEAVYRGWTREDLS
jgi:hypothetical protein